MGDSYLKKCQFFSPHKQAKNKISITFDICHQRNNHCQMVLLPSNLLEAPLFVSRSYTQGRTIKSGVSQLSLLGGSDTV